jgi:hypothetical protein
MKKMTAILFSTLFLSASAFSSQVVNNAADPAKDANAQKEETVIKHKKTTEVESESKASENAEQGAKR